MLAALPWQNAAALVRPGVRAIREEAARRESDDWTGALVSREFRRHSYVDGVYPNNYIPEPLISCPDVRIKQQARRKSSFALAGTSAIEGRSQIIALHRRKIMDAKPPRIPTPDQVYSPDPEPVAVEFLGDELPAHVRAFLDEQRKAHEQQ